MLNRNAEQRHAEKGVPKKNQKIRGMLMLRKERETENTWPFQKKTGSGIQTLFLNPSMSAPLMPKQKLPSFELFAR